MLTLPTVTLPTVTPLNDLTPDEAVALAAGVCRGRIVLRSPEQEARLTNFLLYEQPPHLTCAEHAAWAIRLGDEDVPYTLGWKLLELEKPPVCYHRGQYVYFALNASHIRQMHAAAGREFYLNPQEIGWLHAVTNACRKAGAREVLQGLSVGLGAGRPVHMISPFPSGWNDVASPFDPLRKLLPVWRCRVSGSRVFTHELVRHRTISQEQESQRVSKRDLGRVLPPVYSEAGGDRNDALRHEVDIALDRAERLYEHLIAQGWKREDARYVLPNATESLLVATGHMRAWRHFLALRGHPKVLPEIRYVAWLIHRQIEADLPGSVDDITISERKIEAWIARTPRLSTTTPPASARTFVSTSVDLPVPETTPHP